MGCWVEEGRDGTGIYTVLGSLLDGLLGDTLGLGRALGYSLGGMLTGSRTVPGFIQCLVGWIGVPLWL